jgi:hypothetical protein
MEPIKNNLEFYIILKNKDIPNKIKKKVVKIKSFFKK